MNKEKYGSILLFGENVSPKAQEAFKTLKQVSKTARRMRPAILLNNDVVVEFAQSSDKKTS